MEALNTLNNSEYLTELGAKEIAEHPAKLLIGVYPQKYTDNSFGYAITISKSLDVDEDGAGQYQSLINLQGNTGMLSRADAANVLRKILEEAITLSAKELENSKYQTLTMDMIDDIVNYFKDNESKPWLPVVSLLDTDSRPSRVS